jgi:hypothetical protein
LPIDFKSGKTASTVTGNITSKVWVDNVQPNYVARRYEINPAADAATTGKVTLYFKQADFDAYNATSGIKLLHLLMMLINPTWLLRNMQEQVLEM